jgi:hypothetical protein
MTIIALRIRSSEGRGALIKFLAELLPDARSASKTDLTLLGGIALGILALEDEGDLDWMAELLKHVQTYTDIVINLDVEKCRLLGDHLKNVFASLEGSGTYS